jgi:hypothetical protein
VCAISPDRGRTYARETHNDAAAKATAGQGEVMKGSAIRALLLAAALMGAGTWADAAQLFLPRAHGAQKSATAALPADAMPVTFNRAEMLKLRVQQEAQLTLPDGSSHSFVLDEIKDHGEGVQSWIGHHKQGGRENRAIVTTGPAGSYAFLSTPKGDFSVLPSADGDVMVPAASIQQDMEMGNDARPTPAPALEKAAAATTPAVTKAATAGNPATIDLMILYTPGLASHLGANLTTRFNYLVTRANQAYADSGVFINLRLVHAEPVTYSDAVDNSQALDEVTPSCGGSCSHAFNTAAFGTVETLRTQYGADLVSLLRDGSDFGGAGLAWVGRSTPSANFMYSAIQGCVNGCEFVFIHELGHNMGNMHDRATVAWQSGGVSNATMNGSTQYQGAFPYSYGYAYCVTGTLACNPNVPQASGGCSSQPECGTADFAQNFADIMAYFHNSANRNYKFSGPSTNCAGTNAVNRACGVVPGDPNSADTITSMNNTAPNVAALKATTVGSSAQFVNATYSVLENGGSVVLTVSRSNGGAGQLTVNYATSNGTATAGSDYTATSGTLTWAAGDTANKTITVPIINDAIVEGGESFHVTLSNPVLTGATGSAFIGTPGVADVLIIEPWPAGGTMPTGFTSTTSSVWSVATDSTYEGANSLKSGPVLGTVNGVNGATSTVYTPSTLQFSGNFQAGTVGFAYKVSSYPSYGVFEFAIDGTVTFSADGEAGWSFFSAPITAGAHTLTWTYRNSLPSPCGSGWSPPPPGAATARTRRGSTRSCCRSRRRGPRPP